MKSKTPLQFILAWLCAVCIFVTAASADDEEKKKGPNKGTVEITITSGDEEKTYDNPLKPMTELRRQASKFRRLKEGEVLDFTATITVNGTGYEFSDPIDAQNACQALTAASRRLAAARLGLGDIGAIPTLDPNAAPEQPMPATNPAQARAIIQQRVMQALYQQMIPRPTPGRRPSMPSPPSPYEIQRIYAQELQRARDEGLLPSTPQAALPAADPAQTAKDEALQMLGWAFSKASPADSKTESKDAEEKKPEE